MSEGGDGRGPGGIVDRLRDRARWFLRLQKMDERLRHVEDLAAAAHHEAVDQRALVDEVIEQAVHAVDVAGEARALATNYDSAVHDHDRRLARLERMAVLRATQAWVGRAVVAEALTISVVLPSRDRASLLPAAIGSVTDQSYGRWQLVIVDDGSTDETPKVLASLDDPRMTVLTGPGRGVCAARNAGLRHATGDIVVYLDDDNRMHRDWLKAVAWAFGQHPSTEVLYAARLIDDSEAAHGRPTGGAPWIQFEPWDRAVLENHNFADVGVLAHRAGLPDATFDEELSELGDWDLFLRLTSRRAPLELPVVAQYYATGAPGRLSGGPDGEREVARVKGKLTR